MQEQRWTLKRMWRFKISTLLVLVTIVAFWLAIRFNREPVSIENLRQLRQRERIDVDIWKVVWSIDGSRVALVGWEKPVQVHDGVTLWNTRTIGHDKKIIHFAFSRDENRVAYCENGKQPCLLDLASGSTIVLEAPAGQSKLSFSPDGKTLVSGTYSTSALLWDVDTGQLLHQLDVGPTTGGLTAVFSPDGRYIAVGNRNSTTHVFLASTGALVSVLPKRMSQELSFHPALPVLAVGYVDASIGLWNVDDGRLLHEVQTTAEEIYTLDWSPDGQILASAGLRGRIDFWNGNDLTKLHSLPAPEWTISVRFRPDMRGLIIAGGDQQPGGKRFVQELVVPSLLQKMVRSG